MFVAQRSERFTTVRPRSSTMASTLPLTLFNPGEVISRCKAPNTLALTFDDGPSHLTDQLLDLLDKHQVKATFFITGGKKGRGRIDDPSLPWASVLHRMYESGHQIASHTWAHQKFHKLNNTMRRREIIYNEMAFRNLLGLIPTYIRVPFFGYDEAGLNYLGKLGYHVIDANLVPRDWAPGSPRERFLKGLDLNRTSYIALAHDIFPESVFGLAEYMITRARDSGLRVVTVGECMGDPKKNWYRKAGGPLTVQPNATSLEYPPN